MRAMGGFKETSLMYAITGIYRSVSGVVGHSAYCETTQFSIDRDAEKEKRGRIADEVALANIEDASARMHSMERKGVNVVPNSIRCRISEAHAIAAAMQSALMAARPSTRCLPTIGAQARQTT